MGVDSFVNRSQVPLWIGAEYLCELELSTFVNRSGPFVNQSRVPLWIGVKYLCESESSTFVNRSRVPLWIRVEYLCESESSTFVNSINGGSLETTLAQFLYEKFKPFQQILNLWKNILFPENIKSNFNFSQNLFLLDISENVYKILLEELSACNKLKILILLYLQFLWYFNLCSNIFFHSLKYQSCTTSSWKDVVQSQKPIPCNFVILEYME